ncbi:hypothetical protein D4T97_013100 [Siminovitchia acidinfaciens]|uniref:Uncharacterized protein n=1 Tax=Siminovitchia acidinfaciens TaxID=2321395 RepID=A0A429XYI7_9BACI|nr:hypothetical protein D4T97_013100 [Siminovitchia acidinfaciens]
MIIILIAMFTLGQASLSYISQYNYLNEIGQYYEKEIQLQLVKGKHRLAYRDEGVMNLLSETQGQWIEE